MDCNTCEYYKRSCTGGEFCKESCEKNNMYLPKKDNSCLDYVKNAYPLGSDRRLIEYLAERIDKLQAQIDRLTYLEAFIDAGATVRKAAPGEEGGIYVKGKKLTDEDIRNSLFVGPEIKDKFEGGVK